MDERYAGSFRSHAPLLYPRVRLNGRPIVTRLQNYKGLRLGGGCGGAVHKYEALVKVADPDQTEAETQEGGNPIETAESGHIGQKDLEYREDQDGESGVPEPSGTPPNTEAQQHEGREKPDHGIGVVLGI